MLRVGWVATNLPSTKESIKRETPITVACRTAPGLIFHMYSPMSMAIGMVAKEVKADHGLIAVALTTTRARTANKMIRMEYITKRTTSPPNLPKYSLAMAPKLLPPVRMDIVRMSISWTAPATTAPMGIQITPGR